MEPILVPYIYNGQDINDSRHTNSNINNSIDNDTSSQEGKYDDNVMPTRLKAQAYIMQCSQRNWIRI